MKRIAVGQIRQKYGSADDYGDIILICLGVLGLFTVQWVSNLLLGLSNSFISTIRFSAREISAASPRCGLYLSGLGL